MLLSVTWAVARCDGGPRDLTQRCSMEAPRTSTALSPRSPPGHAGPGARPPFHPLQTLLTTSSPSGWNVSSHTARRWLVWVFRGLTWNPGEGLKSNYFKIKTLIFGGCVSIVGDASLNCWKHFLTPLAINSSVTLLCWAGREVTAYTILWLT